MKPRASPAWGNHGILPATEPLPAVRRPERYDQTIEDVGLRDDALRQSEALHDLPEHERAAEDHVLTAGR